MLKQQEVKPTPCPECNSDIVFGKNTIVENIIRYKPVLCEECRSNFAFNPIMVFVFLIFALALTGLGVSITYYMPHLQELKEVYPNLKGYVLFVVVVVTLTTALLFKYVVPTLVKWQNNSHFRWALHYSTLFISCISFAFVIYNVITRT